MSRSALTSVWLFAMCPHLIAEDSVGDLPRTPRIESVIPVEVQPHEALPSTIWYDDFDDDSNQERYAERSGQTTNEERFGETGKALRMHYPKASRGIGNRKVFFGDSPTHLEKTVRRHEKFTDVFWRIYVKHPHDWKGGGPAKLSRATSLVPPGWRQSMIAHVWSSGEALTLDPATGIRNGRVATTRYNDFKNLRWLGNKPASRFKLHGRDGAGWWVCVEARAKLNSPGKQDGLNQLWIDGRLEAERNGLDWRGDYDGHGINAVFLEAYWNEGSPVDQSRWIDHFVVSTQPIGPVVCPRNPVFKKTPYIGPGSQRAWSVEVAGGEERDVVWRSNQPQNENRVTVGTAEGSFVGALEGKQQLGAGKVYIVRVRQQGDDGSWSTWSDWHQSFRTEIKSLAAGA